MTKYLIVGSGRVARHIHHYFDLLSVDHFTWERKSELSLEVLAAQTETVLLAISDSAIETFVENHSFLRAKTLIHFCGALTLPQVDGAHPLMTFGHELYDLKTYENIPFMTEKNRPTLKDLIPELPNTSFAIPSEKKPLYHSLCVMAGNFTTILWENTFKKFEEELQLPRMILLPFLERTALNLKSEGASQLTGPLARNDVKTIIRHLDALQDLPEQSLYYAFLNFMLNKKRNIELGPNDNLRF